MDRAGGAVSWGSREDAGMWQIVTMQDRLIEPADRGELGKDLWLWLWLRLRTRTRYSQSEGTRRCGAYAAGDSHAGG